jgi:hypothetical protein
MMHMHDGLVRAGVRRLGYGNGDRSHWGAQIANMSDGGIQCQSLLQAGHGGAVIALPFDVLSSAVFGCHSSIVLEASLRVEKSAVADSRPVCASRENVERPPSQTTERPGRHSRESLGGGGICAIEARRRCSTVIRASRRWRALRPAVIGRPATVGRDRPSRCDRTRGSRRMAGNRAIEGGRDERRVEGDRTAIVG